VFIVFFGKSKNAPRQGDPGVLMLIPMVTLAALSIGGSLIPLPWAVLHGPVTDHDVVLQSAASAVSVIGIFLAYRFYFIKPTWSVALLQWPSAAFLHRLWYEGWGFDALYNRLLVRPFVSLAQLNRNDLVDTVYSATAWLNVVTHKVLSQTQTGHVRLYTAGVVSGAVILLGISLIL
jgi:NADH-quinone oxidoreductase subunit L